MTEIPDDAMKEFRNGAGVLFFVFLVLKLMHVIDWSWWFVTAPIWLPATVLFVVNVMIVGVRAIWRWRR